MANRTDLFGVSLFQYTPIDVFPYDPDYNYRRGRKWETSVVKFSPILEQRFVLSGNPLVTYEIGFEVLTGDIQDVTSRAYNLWTFFNDHRGRAVLFWYYDPVVWGGYVDPYRSDPTTRLEHPTDATRARYIALFDDDEMDSERFERRLQKSQLKISCILG